MDERVKGEYRKIYSELTVLMIYAAAASLLIKYFLLDMGPEGCVTEFIILVGSPVYLLVRQLMLGLDAEAGLTAKKRRRKVWTVIVCGAAGFLLAAVLKHGRLEGWAFEYILSFTAICVFVHYISGKLTRYFAERRSRRYEE